MVKGERAITRAWARIWGFVKSEPVFSAALIAALLSMIAVPPNPAYAGYIKWRTLGLLVIFMLCVAGLQKAGAFERVAHALLARVGHAGHGGRRGGAAADDVRPVVAVLVGLTFVAAMLITNDVSLLTFVSFSLMVLDARGRRDLIPLVLSLQTIAANAGSYLTPFGNPHNLYTFTLFDVPMVDFLGANAPFTFGSAVALGACIAVFAKGRGGVPVQAEGAATSGDRIAGEAAVSQPAMPAEAPVQSGPAASAEAASVPAPASLDRRQTVIFCALFALAVLAVLKVVPVWLCLAVVAAVAAVLDWRLFAKVDWLLLGTFVCFFVFSSNLAAIPAVSEILGGAMGQQPFWITLCTSQVISNVPACTLLAPFTTDWRALAVGANLGGMGSPVGSLASLITLGFYRRQCGPVGPYMKVFLAFNFAFLALNCIIWVLVSGL